MASIYVQPLGAYNEGKGGGKWVEIDGFDKGDIWAAIKKVLKKSPVKREEEWIISDYDDMPNMGETPDIGQLAEIVELLDDDHGAAVEVYIDHVGEQYFTVEGFEDASAGVYKDMEEFGWESLEAHGDIPDWLVSYIDVERYARDLLMGDYFGEYGSDGLFYVFSRR